MGHLSYADDITVNCPSMQGLIKIMNVCSDFETNKFYNFSCKENYLY